MDKAQYEIEIYTLENEVDGVLAGFTTLERQIARANALLDYDKQCDKVIVWECGQDEAGNDVRRMAWSSSRWRPVA